MTDIDVTDKDALTLLLRSKTALGRLVESEVQDVLAFLESIGFVHSSQVVEPAPIADLAPTAEPIIAPPPA